jgi:putative FmdB family regulatory protein
VQFDRHQKFSEETLKNCPECGKPALRKLYSPVGIVFKGSGFYSTDNRSPSGRTSTKKEAKPESKADDSKKSETVSEKTKSED